MGLGKGRVPLPAFALTALVIVLSLILWDLLRTAIPDLVVQAERDKVQIARSEALLESLLAPQQTPLANGNGIQVNDLGWATLKFGNGLRAELHRGAQLETVFLESQSEVIRLRHNLGAIFNKFDAEATVAKHLIVESASFEDEFLRIVNLNVNGTEFIVALEDTNPLLWVVPLEAGENDLTINTIDRGQSTQPVALAVGNAAWLAPTGVPILVPFSPQQQQQVSQWLVNLRGGLPTEEIGDALWAPAQAQMNGQDFQSQGLQVIQRNQPVRIRLRTIEQGAVDLILDPGRQSSNPDEAFLEDCDQDGLLDIPVQNELLQIDLRPITARVREVAVLVYNRAPVPAGELSVFDPAGEQLNLLRLTVGTNMSEILKSPAGPTSLDDPIYHRAVLYLGNGCLLSLELTPPPSIPVPTTTAPASPIPVVPPPMITPPSTPAPIPSTPAIPEAPATISQLPLTPTVMASACLLPGWVPYTTELGDTWDRLAGRTNSSVYDLQQANRLAGNLPVGQDICLPRPPATFTPIPDDTPSGQEIPTPSPIFISTPVGPSIASCTPASQFAYEVEVILEQAPAVVTATLPPQNVFFTCTGTNLRPTEAGFIARLSGPDQVVLEVVGGSSTNLQALIPLASLRVGRYDLIVINPDGQSTLKSAAFTVEARPTPDGPTIFGFTPGSGFNDENTIITVAGGNFRPNEAGFRLELLPFEGSAANLELTGSRSATFLTAIVPAGLTPALYQLRVTNPDGQTDVSEDIFEVRLAQPDLIAEITGPPAAQPNEDIGPTIYLTVTNSSRVSSTSVLADFVLSPDPQIDNTDRRLIEGRVAVPPLAAGDSVNVPLDVQKIPVDQPPGGFYLGVIVDSLNDQPESDESNNTASSPIQIIQPDLRVVEIIPTLTNTNVFTYYKISVVINNQGTGDASTAFTVEWELQDPGGTPTPPCQWTVQNLPAQASVTLTDDYMFFCNTSFPLGPSFATVDTTNVITESNENNNRLDHAGF